MELLYILEEYFQLVLEYGILFLEAAGVTVLLITAAKSILVWLCRRKSVQLGLARGIALALEFKLGGEVLRTVIVRNRNELLMLGITILLRGALTVLIHWEIKGEEARIRAESIKKE